MLAFIQSGPLANLINFCSRRVDVGRYQHPRMDELRNCIFASFHNEEILDDHQFTFNTHVFPVQHHQPCLQRDEGLGAFLDYEYENAVGEG